MVYGLLNMTTQLKKTASTLIRIYGRHKSLVAEMAVAEDRSEVAVVGRAIDEYHAMHHQKRRSTKHSSEERRSA
jgi:hypothetical protein